MLAVRSGMTYHYGFIKIDEDHKDKDKDFIFNVVASSFPTREHVSAMISKYRQESERTLYTSKTSELLHGVFNKRSDLEFGMIYEDNTWRLMQRVEVSEKDVKST